MEANASIAKNNESRRERPLYSRAIMTKSSRCTVVNNAA